MTHKKPMSIFVLMATVVYLAHGDGLTLRWVTREMCFKCGRNICQNFAVNDANVGNDNRATVGDDMTSSECIRVRAGTQLWRNSKDGKVYYVDDSNDYWYSSQPCPTANQIRTVHECLLAKPALQIDKQGIVEHQPTSNRPGGCFRHKEGNAEFNSQLTSPFVHHEYFYICKKFKHTPKLMHKNDDPLQAPFIVSPQETTFQKFSSTIEPRCNQCFSNAPPGDPTGSAQFIVTSVTAGLPWSSAISASINALIGFYSTSPLPIERLFNEMTYQNNLDRIYATELDLEAKATEISEIIKDLGNDNFPDEPFQEADSDGGATNPRCYPRARKMLANLVSKTLSFVTFLQITLDKITKLSASTNNVLRGHMAMRILQILPYLIEMATSANIGLLESELTGENMRQKWHEGDLRYTGMIDVFEKLKNLTADAVVAARNWIFQDCHSHIETKVAKHGCCNYNYGFYTLVGRRPGNCQGNQFTRFFSYGVLKFKGTFYCGTDNVNYVITTRDKNGEHTRGVCNIQENIVKAGFEGKFGKSSIIQHKLKIMEKAVEKLKKWNQIRQRVSPDARHTPVYYYLLSVDKCSETNQQLATCVLLLRKYHEDNKGGDTYNTDYCGIKRQKIDTTQILDFRDDPPTNLPINNSLNGVNALYSNVWSLPLICFFGLLFSQM
jgi:hypothetical protein